MRWGGLLRVHCGGHLHSPGDLHALTPATDGSGGLRALVRLVADGSPMPTKARRGVVAGRGGL
ncbi:hypothetical protein [Actinoallomurus bryophytorum]|uniref:hypothetical protein n=1 Tax=Actinoallomurus bryophytorum TaxID=1490222 RepID=UPI001C89FF55|nr:hypothetical protein [Actinoallomurus bryophytorum]